MRQSTQDRKRFEAQGVMWDAMDVISGGDERRAARLCHTALGIYPDCVDALAMLAEIKCERVNEYVDEMRKVIEAGRRDLGARCFKRDRGDFWGIIETRPYMRAMAQLGFALLGWGAPERVDEAIEIFEEMLDLNPNDNQGVRDWLAGCHLARKRYDDARMLFARYPDDWLAAPAWAKVLLAHVSESAEQAAKLLGEARKRNAHVEPYLTGRKRRPKGRPGAYSPGDETEAVYCADMLWEAWKAHPRSRKWLKEAGGTRG